GGVNRRQRGTVTAAQADQQFPQAVWHDRPAKGRGRHALDLVERERQSVVAGRIGVFHDTWRVVVDPQPFQRGVDQLEVVILDERGVRLWPQGAEVRIGAEQHRVVEQPVVQRVIDGGRGDVVLRFTRGPYRSAVVGDKDAQTAIVQFSGGEAVRE